MFGWKDLNVFKDRETKPILKFSNFSRGCFLSVKDLNREEDFFVVFFFFFCGCEEVLLIFF